MEIDETTKFRRFPCMVRERSPDGMIGKGTLMDAEIDIDNECLSLGEIFSACFPTITG